MNIHKRIQLIPLLALGLVMLTACSGGGDDGIDGTGAIEIIGTAAIGAPIANTSVAVKANDGSKKSAFKKNIIRKNYRSKIPTKITCNSSSVRREKFLSVVEALHCSGFILACRGAHFPVVELEDADEVVFR